MAETALKIENSLKITFNISKESTLDARDLSPEDAGCEKYIEDERDDEYEYDKDPVNSRQNIG